MELRARLPGQCGVPAVVECHQGHFEQDAEADVIVAQWVRGEGVGDVGGARCAGALCADRLG